MARNVANAKKQIIDTPVDIILLSAGQGRRMKSFGSKSLFIIGGKTLIEHQIDTIKSVVPKAQIIAVLGYEIDKVEKVLPHDIRIVENPYYEYSTSTKSAMIGVRASSFNDVLIINGDLWFNNKSLEVLCGETSVLVDNLNQISNDKISVVSNNNYVSHFSFGMETPWGQMISLHSGDIDLFYKLCIETKQEMIISEIFNIMISRGCNIKTVIPPKCKVVEIDTIKDLERIK